MIDYLVIDNIKRYISDNNIHIGERLPNERTMAEMFKDCKALFSVALPPHLEFIEEGMFDGCASLDAVVVPNDLSHIEAWAFTGTGLAPDDLALPENCHIADSAFDAQ